MAETRKRSFAKAAGAIAVAFGTYLAVRLAYMFVLAFSFGTIVLAVWYPIELLGFTYVGLGLGLVAGLIFAFFAERWFTRRFMC